MALDGRGFRLTNIGDGSDPHDAVAYQQVFPSPSGFTNVTITGTLTYGGVTLTNAVTGTGKMVLQTSPSIATPTITGALTYGGVALASAVTGTGNMVLSAAPTLTGTLTAAIANFSGAVGIGGVAAVSNATASTSISTGAVTVVGGVGIGGDTRIGGHILVGGTSPVTGGLVELQFDGSLINGVNLLDSSAAGTNFAMAFRRAGTQIGSITTTAAATAFNTSSDRDRKTDERSFDLARSVIDGLKVWDFAWKASGKRAVGVFAQDAYEVFPDAITPSETKGGWQADYSRFVPVLIASNQELYREIDALKRNSLMLPRSLRWLKRWTG